jgi:DNA repair exonuclease SbcCD nuclease subunit
MEIKNKKIGLFSDIHIGLGGDFKTHYETALKFSEWSSNIFLNKGVTDIFILGDVFHNRNEISVETLSVANKFFESFKDFRLFISTGNHDCFLKNKSDINSISILNGRSNINVYDNNIGIFNYKNKKLSLIPWGIEINDIPNSDYMMGHFEIKTFNMNSYKMCDHGLTSDSLLNKSPYILSGHFHSKQHREYKRGKISYIGSPYQQNFGDCNEKRGIHILDLEDSNLEFIENEISPKFFKLKISEYKKNIKNYTDVIKNNIISLIIDEKIEPEDIISTKELIYKTEPKTIRIDYENIENNYADNNNIDYDSSNIVKSIEDFVNTMDVENKELIINYLKELYQKLT